MHFKTFLAVLSIIGTNSIPAHGQSTDPSIRQERTGFFGGLFSGSGANGGSQIQSSSTAPSGLQPCGTIQMVSKVNVALKEAMEFRSLCHITKSSVAASKPMAISDFSSKPAVTYVFSATGECMGKVETAYGSGNSSSKGVSFPPGRTEPMACSDPGKLLTPPGFHFTAPHSGGTYNSSEAMKLVGLNGQGSFSRAILIHQKGPMGPTTHGCSGVSPEAFKSIQGILGDGALVYNYFGDEGKSSNCSSSAGVDPSPGACKLDPGAPGPSRQFGPRGSVAPGSAPATQ